MPITILTVALAEGGLVEGGQRAGAGFPLVDAVLAVEVLAFEQFEVADLVSDAESARGCVAEGARGMSSRGVRQMGVGMVLEKFGKIVGVVAGVGEKVV